MDIKSTSEELLAKIRFLEGASEKAKKAYEEAPIRTGIREDAQNKYFKLVETLQRTSEQYRYYSTKLDARLKHDTKTYPEYFEKKLPWPNPEEFKSYLTDKKLKTASREWDQEKRIKERQARIAASLAPPPGEHGEGGEGGHGGGEHGGAPPPKAEHGSSGHH